ncbi:hypothetical protein V6N13_053735 [Hibiscus sabdariffa]|uniref:Uncharacterized protein n=1 Tax=Hibiscus sabdariffa TaxID=183260 RepID=A0ABR2T785_9ROSI
MEKKNHSEEMITGDATKNGTQTPTTYSSLIWPAKLTMFPTNHLISVHVAVKIPAPDRPYLQSMLLTNLFPVFESLSDYPNLVRSCNLCFNIDAYQLICW